MPDDNKATFRFRIAVLNDDDSIADFIDTNDGTYEDALAKFPAMVKEYVAEGFDGIAMQAERDPADYR
jgi:hypothetical protein